MTETKKIKVMMIADAIMAPSGVANQMRHVVDALWETGKFSFVYLGGAVKHQNYQPIKLPKYGDDLIMYPVDGYGDANLVRSLIKLERPDMLFFMTDPRFYEWLWMIENEVRSLIPMVYFHVWDNYPVPKYNKKYLESNDFIFTISKLTDDICKTVAPNVPRKYVGHAVNNDIFRNLGDSVKEEVLPQCKDKFVLFYNGRNARRKMVGTSIYWFGKFLDIVGHDKACFLLHTDSLDPHGPNLNTIVKDFGLDKGQVLFSTDVLSEPQLAQLYNAADLGVFISDAEGFGLGVSESLSCETPVMATVTGGIQDQITDGKNWFGRGLRPVSQMIVGTQAITPYIFEDRIAEQDYVKNLKDLYKMWKTKPEKYKKLGEMGRKHIMKNYSLQSYKQKFADTMLEIHERCGSWETRKGYKSWSLVELSSDDKEE